MRSLSCVITSLSCDCFSYHYLWFNQRISGYYYLKCYAIIILGLRPYLLCLRPLSSVQPIVPPSSLPRRSRFSSLHSCISIIACHVSVPTSMPLLPFATLSPCCCSSNLYPRQGCHVPSVGRHLCVSFFILALLGVSRTLCSHLNCCLAGCSMYPILMVCLLPIAYCLSPIAFRLLPFAYCLLSITCRCRCYVSRQDQV